MSDQAEEKQVPVIQGREYSLETRLKVVEHYMLVGNMRIVAEATGIGYNTLCRWKQEPWWYDMQDELKKQTRAKTTGKMGKLVNSAMNTIEDRLANGELILDKKGNLVRRPVSLQAANRVASDLIDKQIKLEELEKREVQQTISVHETLKVLATEFAKWTKKQNNDVIDVEVKEISDAIHEERSQDGEVSS